jgi:hypothetical protein
MARTARWIRRSAVGLTAAVLAGGLALGTATPAGADDHEVTTGADSGPGSLRQALLDAADDTTERATITFAPGIRVELASSLEWAGDPILDIVGPATIDGNGAHQALVVDADILVSLTSMTVVDAGGADGSAIEVTEGTLSVSSSTFRDNQSDEGGGAITSTSPDPIDEVLALQSTFTGNESDGDGGAISGPSIRSEGSTYTGNEAGGSGGALAGSPYVSTERSRFSGNVAAVDGGAVETDVLRIDSSTFVGNEAGRDGGAVHATFPDEDNQRVRTSTFDGNVADRNGGAVSVEFEGGTPYYLLELSRSTYVGNEAASGGAVHSSNTFVALAASTFTENRASTAGGAVAAANDAGGTFLRNATLVGNSAPSGAQIASPLGMQAFASVFARPLGGGLNCAVPDSGSAYSRDSGTSCGLAIGLNDTNSVQSAPDPQLGPLRQTGGPTAVMVPAATSPLVDQQQVQPEYGCTTDPENVDQRGAPRKVGVGCDIGAVERQTNTFGDVSDGAAFFLDVEWMAAEGISTGTPASPKPLYKPSAPVSRSAMSAFLYRFQGSPAFTPPTEATFADVSTTNPFFLEIEWMAAEGISTGTPGSPKPTFKPAAPVTRQAMSAFLFRLFPESSDEFQDPASATFTDVSATHPFFTEVEWMASVGISTGYEPGPTYRPGTAVSRQAMSAFLHRIAPS